MFLTNIFELAQRLEDCCQTILTFDKVDVLFIESEVNLYQWIYIVN